MIILGLASSLPAALNHGLTAQGVPAADAARLAALPPVSIMFAALLGYNPVGTLLGPALAKLPASHAAYLTGHSAAPSADDDLEGGQAGVLGVGDPAAVRGDLAQRR